ncbi:MAG: pyridoxal-phosphate dependent enzyme, partial [Halobacteria archaeon]|nr:pyridoxal-phosphate dependent enzyme [Halobacteria archaeon]
APKARRAVKETGGTITSVSDVEITEAQSQLATKEGIGVEPASATSIAGTRKLVDEGVISPDETVVCVATGHLLKDPDAAVEASGRPTNVEADEDAVKDALRC